MRGSRRPASSFARSTHRHHLHRHLRLRCHRRRHRPWLQRARTWLRLRVGYRGVGYLGVGCCSQGRSLGVGYLGVGYRGVGSLGVGYRATRPSSAKLLPSRCACTQLSGTRSRSVSPARSTRSGPRPPGEMPSPPASLSVGLPKITLEAELRAEGSPPSAGPEALATDAVLACCGGGWSCGGGRDEGESDGDIGEDGCGGGCGCGCAGRTVGGSRRSGGNAPPSIAAAGVVGEVGAEGRPAELSGRWRTDQTSVSRSA